MEQGFGGVGQRTAVEGHPQRTGPIVGPPGDLFHHNQIIAAFRGGPGDRARPWARPAVVRMSGAPPAPCSRARRLRQRARKHQPPRPPSRPSSPRRAHTTARSPVRATIRYSSRPPDRRPVPARRTRGGHVTARRATTIQATTAERGTAAQDIPPAGTGRASHYQSRSNRGRPLAQSVRPIFSAAGVRPRPRPGRPAQGFPRRCGRGMLSQSFKDE